MMTLGPITPVVQAVVFLWPWELSWPITTMIWIFVTSKIRAAGIVGLFRSASILLSLSLSPHTTHIHNVSTCFSSSRLATYINTYFRAYSSRSRYSRSPSPPRRRRRSPSYSRSRSPSYSSRSRSRSPRRSLSPTLTPKNTVLVTNLTRNVTAEHVKEIFAQFGSVVKVDFPLNHRCKHHESSTNMYIHHVIQ